MDRLLEFAAAHPYLVGSFFVLLIAFIVLETRRGGKSVSPQQLTNLVNKEAGVVLDIREGKDFREGHITGSLNMPLSGLKERLSELEKYKEQPVVLVCNMGQHAGSAGRILSVAGFKDVRRLNGGINGWKTDGLPLVS